MLQSDARVPRQVAENEYLAQDEADTTGAKQRVVPQQIRLSGRCQLAHCEQRYRYDERADPHADPFLQRSGVEGQFWVCMSIKAAWPAVVIRASQV